MSFGPTTSRGFAGARGEESRTHPSFWRLFVRVSNPNRFADDIVRGCFIATRLYAPRGEAILLSLLIDAVGRPLDVPVVVVGRRAPPVSRGGAVGLLVRAREPMHPVLSLLRKLASGAVDLERSVQEHSRLHVASSFRSLEELRIELRRLLVGEIGILPVHKALRPGDPLDVTVSAHGHTSLASFRAVARAVARSGEKIHCLAALVDDEESREAVRRALQLPPPSPLSPLLSSA